jgi:hypothetical protein
VSFDFVRELAKGRRCKHCGKASCKGSKRTCEALRETYRGSNAGEAHPHHHYDKGPFAGQKFPKGTAPGSPPSAKMSGKAEGSKPKRIKHVPSGHTADVQRGRDVGAQLGEAVRHAATGSPRAAGRHLRQAGQAYQHGSQRALGATTRPGGRLAGGDTRAVTRGVTGRMTGKQEMERRMGTPVPEAYSGRSPEGSTARTVEDALRSGQRSLGWGVDRRVSKKAGKKNLQRSLTEVDADAEGLRKAMERAELRKAGGPFIGPRGGKWADAKHTIPWKDGGAKKTHTAHSAVLAVHSAVEAANIGRNENHPHQTIEKFRTAVNAAAESMAASHVSTEDAQKFARHLSEEYGRIGQVHSGVDSTTHKAKLKALRDIMHTAGTKLRRAHGARKAQATKTKTRKRSGAKPKQTEGFKPLTEAMKRETEKKPQWTEKQRVAAETVARTMTPFTSEPVKAPKHAKDYPDREQARWISPMPQTQEWNGLLRMTGDYVKNYPASDPPNPEHVAATLTRKVKDVLGYSGGHKSARTKKDLDRLAESMRNGPSWMIHAGEEIAKLSADPKSGGEGQYKQPKKPAARDPRYAFRSLGLTPHGRDTSSGVFTIYGNDDPKIKKRALSIAKEAGWKIEERYSAAEGKAYRISPPEGWTPPKPKQDPRRRDDPNAPTKKHFAAAEERRKNEASTKAAQAKLKERIARHEAKAKKKTERKAALDRARKEQAEEKRAKAAAPKGRRKKSKAESPQLDLFGTKKAITERGGLAKSVDAVDTLSALRGTRSKG